MIMNILLRIGKIILIGIVAIIVLLIFSLGLWYGYSTGAFNKASNIKIPGRSGIILSFNGPVSLVATILMCHSGLIRDRFRERSRRQTAAVGCVVFLRSVFPGHEWLEPFCRKRYTGCSFLLEPRVARQLFVDGYLLMGCIRPDRLFPCQ